MSHRIEHTASFAQAIEIADWMLEEDIPCDKSREFWQAIRAGARDGLASPVPFPGMSQSQMTVGLTFVLDSPQDAVDFMLRFVG